MGKQPKTQHVQQRWDVCSQHPFQQPTQIKNEERRASETEEEREISVIVIQTQSVFSSAKRHTSQTREKDVGIMSVFMYDSINQRCVQLAGRSMETLLSCRAKRELTGRTMGFCELRSLFFSFHSFSSYFLSISRMQFPSFLVDLRPRCSLLVYWFSRLRIPWRGIVTHNQKIILGCAYLPSPCIYLACVCRQLCFPSPVSGANNEGQIESYV